MLDIDIRAFFDTLDHAWLITFVEHRIGDRRIVRLIKKWLRAGTLEGGKWTQEQAGTVQGGSISPHLANIYLHYVFDLWTDWWRKCRARGEVIVVRFADDIVMGFQHREEAEHFWRMLVTRLARFGLALHPEKTRLLRFGRFAAQNRKERGEGKPETFDFLGFTHICGKTRRGKFTVRRKTRKGTMRAKLKEIHQELRRRMHVPVPDQGRYLRAVVTGHSRYFGVPGNSRSLSAFRWAIGRLWRQALRRRSQNARITWARMKRLIASWLPPPRICLPHPSARFAV